jgi:hypothetical protein
MVRKISAVIFVLLLAGTVTRISRAHAGGLLQRMAKKLGKLIQKIRRIDPLTFPKCQERMKIISFIGDEKDIEKIFEYLHLRDIKGVPVPQGGQALLEVK